MARNLFPKRRFRSDILHSQIGTRGKKTVLNHQFGNNKFHSQMGIRNQNGAKCLIVEQTVPFADGNSDQNSPKFGPK